MAFPQSTPTITCSKRTVSTSCAGLRDGSVVLNDAVRLPLHSCAVERVAVSRDRCGILSVSGTRGHGLALSEFLFNCEKAYTVDAMFASDK
jgi:hypothetical protein